MRMRIMLLGADSLLGQAVVQLAAQDEIAVAAPQTPVGGWQSSELAALFAEHRPDCVVNLTYYHEQFQLGSCDDATLAAIRDFNLALIKRCALHGTLLLQLSSARVFDGLKQSPYVEKDELAPGDALGQLQSELESRLLTDCERHLLLRLSWLLDSSADGQLGKLIGQLSSKQPVLLAEEWRGNPTPVADAARVIIALLKQLDCDAPLYGVYHYGSSEVSSWISFAKSLAQELMASKRLDHDPLIRSVPFDQQTDTAWEPQNAALASRRVLMSFGIKPRAWRSQLPELLKQFDT